MGRTLKQLIECYRTDPHSEFLKLQHQVRIKHDRELTKLVAEQGSIQLRDIRFRTLKEWYQHALSGGKVEKARSLVGRLRELFRFGRSMLEDKECDRLFEALGKLPLEVSPPRRVQMTADHVRSFCRTACEHFGWDSMALAQSMQFELLLGQKDVIGEWVPIDEPGHSNVIVGGKKWLRGLQWQCIDEQLILRHNVGSSGRNIEADLRTAPMVLRELVSMIADSTSLVDGVPAAGSLPSSGPMVICDLNGLPWSQAEFRRKWRLVARKAGIPDNITNRDSIPAGMVRAGPDRAKISQMISLKRMDYSIRVARRLAERSERTQS